MHSGRLFSPGSVVLVTLSSPREKFWGMLLALDQAGVSLRGIDLHSLDDFAQLIKSGEITAASGVFFPMHRVERMELDARNGEIPSLAEQFSAKSGSSAASFLHGPESKFLQEPEPRLREPE